MARFRFLPQAREELAAAIAFYEAESPGLGQDLAREARRLCSRILESPFAGVEIRPGIRRRLMRRFPYAILYGIDRGDVLIVAVAHQRRRPSYWRNRF
ncbi:MAG: type II toxin-antitoxin system RelE/ParE family toxin [Gammaproteobacteria bacterium]|nr:MAG: type II toxin-antitoxin system RelE/ParE family toxin [Gammaproteobacteria bacterium]